MSYFSSKNERDVRAVKPMTEPTAAPRMPERAAAAEQPSVLGRGMQITGNIVATGAVQIFGRVTGDIHAAQLTICEGAKIDGKVVAQDTVVQGTFTGTIHSNSVKLQKTAVVDGEVFSKSLMIEQDAQFEGVSRKLDKSVEPPGAAQAAAASSAGSVTALRPNPAPLAPAAG